MVRNLGKKVILHGIKESFSWQLKEVATEIVTFPSKEECDTAYIKLIVENLCFVSCRRDIYSTYAGTIRAVSKHSKIPEKCVADALSKMLELGYMHTKTLDDDRHQAMLIANWKKLMDAGYYKPENHDRDPGFVL